MELSTTYTITGANYKCFLLSNGIITSVPVDYHGGAAPTITTGPSDNELAISFWPSYYPIDTYMVVKGPSLPSLYIPYKMILNDNVSLSDAQRQEAVNQISSRFTNLFDKNAVSTGYYDEDSTPTVHADNPNIRCCKFSADALTKYTVSGISYKVLFYDANNQKISASGITSGNSGPYTFTTPVNCAYVCLSFYPSVFALDTYMVVKGEKLPNVYVEYNETLFAMNENVVLTNVPVTTCYISPSGSDTSSGSFAFPFATFQHAIDSGYKKIYAIAGDYAHQKIVILNKDHISISTYIDSEDIINYRYARASLNNMQALSVTLDSTTNLYKAVKSSTDRWAAVFTSKSLTPIKSGTQTTSYNAILWEVNGTDPTKHKKLLPVLTLAECQSTLGSFFWDGTNVYIHPSVTYTSDTTYKYLNYEGDGDVGIYIGNSSDISIDGLDVIGFTGENCLSYKSDNIRFANCLFGFSAYSEGCYFRCSTGECNNCQGYQNTDDAFGAQEYATADFINCKVPQSYDDGISHHDGCHGIIEGGLFMHCGKGGLSPTYGAQVTINGVISINNTYGLYYLALQSQSRYTEQQVCVMNSAFKNNTLKDLRIEDYNVLMHGCSYDTKDIYSDNYTSLTEL